MLALLPQDIICHMSTFMEVDYICDDGDEDYNTSTLFAYQGEGQYYPLFCLYATCKSFGWLLEKEFIHVDTGDFYSNIVTKNIKGKCNGMFYQYNENIYGFALYKQDDVICQNTWGNDFAHYYRFVDGKEIIADDCYRPFSYRKKCTNCEHCDLLDKVTEYVKAKDPLIKEILSGNHDYDNGNIFMRDIHDISVKSYYIYWLWLKEQNIIQDIVFYLMSMIFSVVPKVFITQ